MAARKPFTYLPFGAGPRICAGMRLAHMELKMAMVEAIRKYKFIPCSKTEVNSANKSIFSFYLTTILFL